MNISSKTGRGASIAILLASMAGVLALWPSPSPKKPASVTPFKMMIASRAGFRLFEDFRSGLDEWRGSDNPKGEWFYDENGLLHPGSLGIYAPSLKLSNYDVTLAALEGETLGWAFRATDDKNYYAQKLTVLKPGPVPEMALVRYAVVNGRRERDTVIPLPVSLSSGSTYGVQLKVDGKNFTTYVNGKLIDVWSDARLRRGGIGLFSDKRKQTRVVSLEITHQYDPLGKFCAFLAPRL
jgi:hypothetical protein